MDALAALTEIDARLRDALELATRKCEESRGTDRFMYFGGRVDEPENALADLHRVTGGALGEPHPAIARNDARIADAMARP